MRKRKIHGHGSDHLSLSVGRAHTSSSKGQSALSQSPARGQGSPAAWIMGMKMQLQAHSHSQLTISDSQSECTECRMCKWPGRAEENDASGAAPSVWHCRCCGSRGAAGSEVAVAVAAPLLWRRAVSCSAGRSSGAEQRRDKDVPATACALQAARPAARLQTG